MLRRYLNTSLSVNLSTRAFIYLRWVLTPYFEMARHLPKSGKILDLACGHGLFTLAIAELRPNCSVLGVDHDQERVLLAQAAGKNYKNISFTKDDLTKIKFTEKVNAINIIDTLHYFDDKTQNQILSESFKNLEDDGVLLIREVDISPNLRSKWNLFYEKLTTKTGLTKTYKKKHQYRLPHEWAELLRNLGFNVSWKRCSHFLFSDVLFVATKDSKKKRMAPNHINNVQIAADDWGFSPAVNRAIVHLAKKGMIHKVSLVADSEFLKYQLDELMSIDNIQLGLHFNLTYKKKFKSPFSLLCALLSPFDKSQLKQYIISEFVSQFNKLLQLNVKLTHFDGHHHAHTFPGIAQIIAPLAKSFNIKNTRVPWDPKLLFSKKFPLYIFSTLSKPHFKNHAIDWDPCLYPQSKDFSCEKHLENLIRLYPNHEILIHPSDEDDFLFANCPDSYRSGRVTEFQMLNLITQSFELTEEVKMQPIKVIREPNYQLSTDLL